jgi:hypothetical protein
VIAFISLAVILLSALPLVLFTELVGQQARKARAGRAWYLCLVGSWLGGVMIAFMGLGALMGNILRSRELSDWLFYPMLFLAGPVGGSVGPGLIWLHLRLRRTHDPDYGPLGDEARD